MNQTCGPVAVLPENGLIPTARAVVDVNRVCNAKCRMCYYAHVDESWTKPFETVEAELVAARGRGCNSVDFTGGEPTLHPDFSRIIARAEEMGLHTCTLTVGLSLEKVKRAVGAGCREWLVSLHGYESSHDDLVGVKGAWKKVHDTIEYLNREGCFVRINRTLTRYNAADLPRLARHDVEVVRARIVNFINFNPHAEWGKQQDPTVARRLNDVQIRVSEVAPALREALEYLDRERVWANVRYFPMCALPGLESHVCNNPQVMFDPYEWDYGVSTKTTAAHLEKGRSFQQNINSAEGPCGRCGVRNVCGGVNRNYACLHGQEELVPYQEQSDFPYHFRSDLEADIIVPAYVPSETLARLLRDIPRITAPPYNLIVVGRHQSAARNRNQGLERARSPYVIMCDDDIADLPYGWNRQLIYVLKENRELAAVSARLMRADGRPGLNTANDYCLDRPLVAVNHIPTACCAFRRTDVRFDERFVRAGWEDTDYFMQLRQKHGGQVAISNQVKVVHLNEEKNGGGVGNEENQKLFMEKWNKPLAPQDPEAIRVRVAAQLEAREYAVAVEGLRAIVVAGKADGETFNQLGFACWNLGDRQLALEFFAKAVERKPVRDETLSNFFDAAYTLGRSDLVERHLRAHPGEGNARPAHAYLLADCLRRQGRREDARSAMAALAELSADYPGLDQLRRAIDALPPDGPLPRVA
ncbi:MAG TPA: radical SAM protein [Anaeromyxobacteraceae bacterium]|nr:radical SAM protein [Anaeromyxobacteraceae bacterium]